MHIMAQETGERIRKFERVIAGNLGPDWTAFRVVRDK